MLRRLQSRLLGAKLSGVFQRGFTVGQTKLSRALSQQKEEFNPDMFDIGEESRDEVVTESEMYKYKEKNFIDKVRIHVQGGKGGMGCVTHEDTRKGLRGRASGGSGGDGGAVYIRSDIDEPDLSYVRSKVYWSDNIAHIWKPRKAWNWRLT